MADYRYVRQTDGFTCGPTVALVASQDGRFTIFAWSPCESMVHAHRVEALLL